MKNLEILQISASIVDKVSASVFQVSTDLNLITHVFCNTRLAQSNTVKIKLHRKLHRQSRIRNSLISIDHVYNASLFIMTCPISDTVSRRT